MLVAQRNCQREPPDNTMFDIDMKKMDSVPLAINMRNTLNMSVPYATH